VDVIRSAHIEATGARNGIGVVKLMGRHSGFIACPRRARLDGRGCGADPGDGVSARGCGRTAAIAP